MTILYTTHFTPLMSAAAKNGDKRLHGGSMVVALISVPLAITGGLEARGSRPASAPQLALLAGMVLAFSL